MDQLIIDQNRLFALFLFGNIDNAVKDARIIGKIAKEECLGHILHKMDTFVLVGIVLLIGKATLMLTIQMKRQTSLAMHRESVFLSRPNVRKRRGQRAKS